MKNDHLSLTDSRLGKPQSESLNQAVNAPGLIGEAHMFRAYMKADLAHVVMLAEKELVAPDRAAALLASLLDLESKGPSALPMRAELGSLLLQVERFIADNAGQDCAGMLQLARSRIDHNAAATRLDVRDGLLNVMQALIGLLDIVRDRADAWKDIITPGYTHLQHAQPWVLGHAMLCQFDVLSRDLERLFQAYARVNLSSQGTAALSGTSWAVDRDRVSDLLGHSAPVANSKDAGVFAMDFLPDVAGALSLLMSNLGRLASELYIWSSWEFGLVDLDEGLCGTSSIMPQKKNPYALERVRALAGEAIGWMPAQLGLLKTPSTTDCDQVFASGLHGSYFQCVEWSIDLMGATLSTLRPNRERMQERADINWSTASSLADCIVAETGMDFRRAHHVVADLVRASIEAGRRPSETTPENLDAAAQRVLGQPLGLSADVIMSALDARRFVETRTSAGGVAPAEVDRLLVRAEELGSVWRGTVEAEVGKRDAALTALHAAAVSLAKSRS